MDFSPNPQTIGWFRDRGIEGTLDIKPPFQRRPVWTLRQKNLLIETILLNLPVPEIFMQVSVTPAGQSTYAVVDGQQRIRSILQFIGIDRGDDRRFDEFSLDLLPSESPWFGRTFEMLGDEDKVKFYGYVLAMRSLNNASEADVRGLFTRLNKFLTPLSPQELRNAIYTGPFISLANTLSEVEYWAINGIVSPALIRRMKDIEFVSELLIGTQHGPQGGSPSIIDEYYRQYEESDLEFPDQAQVRRRYRLTLDTIEDLLPNIRTTRWKNSTDFYSLFVALATLLRTSRIPEDNLDNLIDALEEFVGQIEELRNDEEADVPQAVKQYVTALVRGSNDKSRRSIRNTVLTALIEPHSVPRRPARSARGAAA